MVTTRAVFLVEVTRRMPARTLLQRHPDRARLEQRLLRGENVLKISNDSGISEASLYRARGQLERELQADQEAQNLSRGAIALRLARLAADLRDARQGAAARGNVRSQVAAAAEERRVLIDLLAVTPELDGIEQEADARVIAAAMAGVLRARGDSTLAAELSAQLKARGGSPQLVGSVEDLAERLRTRGMN